MQNKTFKIIFVFLLLFISACQNSNIQINNLNVEIIHESEDRFLTDIPRSATIPAARPLQVQHSEEISLSTREDSPFKVDYWVVKDFFGNNITVKNSSSKLAIYANYKLVAKMVCEQDSACIQGYNCQENKCVYS